MAFARHITAAPSTLSRTAELREKIAIKNRRKIKSFCTAKTTVARILAGIFHDIGLLESAEPVEVGRSGLVGKYLGETAQKVRGEKVPYSDYETVRDYFRNR